jgi:hypothetical protein
MARILLMMAVAMGLTLAASSGRIDPMPHCFPCPYSN